MIRAMKRETVACCSVVIHQGEKQSLGISVANSEVDEGFHTIFGSFPAVMQHCSPVLKLLHGCLVVFSPS